MMTHDTPLNDEAFAALIDKVGTKADADQIIGELALRLGYVKTVAAWGRALDSNRKTGFRV